MTSTAAGEAPISGSSGSASTAMPPVDMPTLVYEVRSSRNILNQLLRTVSSIGLLDEAKLRRVLGHNREMEGCIVEAYTKV